MEWNKVRGTGMMVLKFYYCDRFQLGIEKTQQFRGMTVSCKFQPRSDAISDPLNLGREMIGFAPNSISSFTRGRLRDATAQ